RPGPPARPLFPYTTLFRSGEGFFRRQAEVLGACAGGDDQCVTAVGAAITLEYEGATLQLGGMDVVVDDLGVEALGVLLHALHQRSEEHTSELQSRENLVCR